MHRLETDPLEPHALGYDERLVEIEVSQRITGQAQMERNRLFRSRRLVAGRYLCSGSGRESERGQRASSDLQAPASSR